MKKSLTAGRTPILERSITTRGLIFLLSVVFCLSPLITPPLALLMGVAISQFIGHPWMHLNGKATHFLLQISVVGLGFGMNVQNAVRAGRAGFLFTVVSIVLTLGLGWLLGRVFHIEKKTSFLIATGTAICGGSAIAAVSPVIKAEEKQISIALGTIFILNSLALFLFPVIGHLLHLSQVQFGLWSAIAIHDTSSVVGAASKYGPEALSVATTVKLARALWILPVAALSGVVFKGRGGRMKIPYFIGLFVLAMILNTYVPAIGSVSRYFVTVAKAGLTLTLFLIGCGLSGKLLLSVGYKPMLQGVTLWLGIAGMALGAVIFF